MAEKYKPNKLLDKAPYDDGRAEPEYPWVGGSQDHLGNRVITYADPEKPDQAFIERIKYDGSFTINEANGLKNEFNKEVRSYTSGGDSHNTDGQKAVYGKSNFNLAFQQDVGFTAGGTTYKGSGEKEIGGTAQGSFQNDTGGNTYKTSNGDMISEHTGHIHSHNDGDNVQSTKGTRYEIVNEGEYAIHVQGGNMDTRVESGKLGLYSGDTMVVNTSSTMLLNTLGGMTVNSAATTKINSVGAMSVNAQSTMAINAASTMTVDAQGDVTINSTSKITFKVGSSTITMSSGSITINSPMVKIN
jgi:hypothetical protein